MSRTSSAGEARSMLLDFDDDGPGPVVVLLHGFPLDRSLWSHQRSTVGAIYRVIAPDLRGHGTSAAPEGIYTVDAMADDVIETLDSLGLTGPVILGGLSMGGYVALSIAARYRERVAALMLINTRASTDTPAAAEARETLARQVETSGDVEPVVTAMLPRLFSQISFKRHPEVVARTHHQMLQTPARTIVGTLRGLAVRPDRLADLAGIAVPTLVLAGSEDHLISIEETQAMAQAMPHSQLVIVPDAGHLSPLENPEFTNAAILEFLRSGW